MNKIWDVVQGNYDAMALEQLFRENPALKEMINTDMDGWTPLHYACDNRQVSSVQILLKMGANVNAVDESGYTPLHLVCKNTSGCFIAVGELIQAGALVNTVTTV